MAVEHDSALCNHDPAVAANALEILPPEDQSPSHLELLWVRVVNDTAATVWLHLYDATLASLPGAVPRAFPATPIQAGDSPLIPIDVEFSNAIAGLVSTAADGTGQPTTPVFVNAAYVFTA